MNGPSVSVIIPAYNEEKSVGRVIAEIPDWVRQIIVVNNASNDNTRTVAQEAGATVLDEPVRGYGSACLKGMEYIATGTNQPDIVVFIDADYSDFPKEMNLLVEPILRQDVDLVIGSRALGDREKGAMTIPQVVGNALATRLLKWLYGVRFTDLGPFRAIRYQRLLELGMKDKNYGWTVEMQLKAAKQKMKCTEVPVNYRNRIGKSKVSGTVKGSIMAGYKIIWTIFKYI